MRVEILQVQRVRAERHVEPGGHVHLLVLIERAAGDADEHQHHAEVNDVAAIAPRVAHGEFAGAEDRFDRPCARRSRARRDKIRSTIVKTTNTRKHQAQRSE